MESQKSPQITDKDAAAWQERAQSGQAAVDPERQQERRPVVSEFEGQRGGERPIETKGREDAGRLVLERNIQEEEGAIQYDRSQLESLRGSISSANLDSLAGRIRQYEGDIVLRMHRKRGYEGKLSSLSA